MIKRIPLDIKQFGFNSDSTADDLYFNPNIDDANKKADEFFNILRVEDPQFWWNGLSTSQFNALDDRIYFLLTDDNKIIGYIGIQPNRYISELDNQEMGDYISVGILPKYRGYGISKKMIPQLLEEYENTVHPLNNPVWTVHEDNTASIRLYNSLLKNEYIRKLGIQLIIEPRKKEVKDPTLTI